MGTEVSKKSEHFERYKRGYMDADMNQSSIIDMIDGWEAFVLEVGRDNAMVQFWEWQKTLPQRQHSDVDPEDSEWPFDSKDPKYNPLLQQQQQQQQQEGAAP